MAHHIIGQDIMRPIFKRNMTYCDTWGTFDGSFSANITLGIFLDSFLSALLRFFFGAQAEGFTQIPTIPCMDWGVMG